VETGPSGVLNDKFRRIGLAESSHVDIGFWSVMDFKGGGTAAKETETLAKARKESMKTIIDGKTLDIFSEQPPEALAPVLTCSLLVIPLRARKDRCKSTNTKCIVVGDFELPLKL